MLLAYYFFVFPSILHKDHGSVVFDAFFEKGKIALMSHRGGALNYPEHSTKAFEESVNLGVQGIELDCLLTQDDLLITHHDRTLDNTTGQTDNISEIDYVDINTFKSEINTGNGIYTLKPGEETLKTALFSELIDIVKNENVFINIDNKTKIDEGFDDILQDLEDNGLLSKTVIGSFDTYDPSALREKFGEEVRFFFPEQPLIMVVVSFLLGFLPFMPLRYDFYETTFAYDRNIDDAGGITKLILQIVDFWWPLTFMINWHLKRRGIRVIYWTVNNESNLDDVYRVGAEGIITDYPIELKDLLISKDLYIN